VLVQLLFQHTLKYLTLLSMAEYFEQDAANPELNRLLGALQRPQYGHWVAFLHSAEKHFATRPPAFFPELRGILRTPVRKGLSAASLVDRFVATKNALISHRNGLYGTPLAEIREALHGLEEPYFAWLESLAWLTRYPLCVRTPEGLLRLSGETPAVFANPAPDVPAQLFFVCDDRPRVAFPLYFWLGTGGHPGLYLFEGATPRQVVYLSHDACHVERDPAVVGALVERFTRKHLQLEAIVGELHADALADAAADATRACLARFGDQGRYTATLFVRRPALDDAFAWWRAGGLPGMLLTGDAGSGKSTVAYRLAEDLVAEGAVALLLPARELGSYDSAGITRSILKHLRRREPLGEVLEALGGRELFVLLEALEDAADPALLLASVVGLMREHGVRFVVTVRTTVLPSLGALLADAPFARFTTSGGERPWFTLERLDDAEFEAFFERYRAAHGIPTTSLELTRASVLALRSPLLLKLACETFRGEALPPHVSLHRVFGRYLAQKIGDPITRRLDPACDAFLLRFVALLYERRVSRLDLADLLDDPALGRQGLGPPLEELLSEGLLSEVVELDELMLTRRWVCFAFDRVHELMLMRHLKATELEDLADLTAEEPPYLPLQGALSLRLLLAGDRADIADFAKVSTRFEHIRVRTALTDAVADLACTRPAFVTGLVRAWGADGGTTALSLAATIVLACFDAGRWDQGRELFAALRESAGPAYSPAVARAGLAVARFSVEDDPRAAMAEVRMYLDAPDADVRAMAALGLILAADRLPDPAELVAASRGCVALGERGGDLDLQALGAWAEGTAAEYRGDPDEALACYARVLRLGANGMRPYSDTLAPLHRWMARALSMIPARIPEAEDHYLKAMRLDEGERNLYFLSLDWNNLAHYLLERGDLARAKAYSDRELSQHRLFPRDPQWAQSWYLRGCILFLLGDRDGARVAADRAVELAKEPDHVAYATFVRACVDGTLVVAGTSLVGGALARILDDSVWAVETLRALGRASEACVALGMALSSLAVPVPEAAARLLLECAVEAHNPFLAERARGWIASSR
jgi:tetratricopeptide (TPR) repeat protein